MRHAVLFLIVPLVLVATVGAESGSQASFAPPKRFAVTPTASDSDATFASALRYPSSATLRRRQDAPLRLGHVRLNAGTANGFG